MDDMTSICADISKGKERIPIPLEDKADIPDVTDFVYVLCPIPGPDTERAEFRSQIAGCHCVNESDCSTGCECISRFGPSYDKDGRVIVKDADTPSHCPVFECNRACACKASCKNRLVQSGVHHKLSVFRTPGKGLGLRAQQFIEKNMFVCEYAGEVLDRNTAAQRTKILASKHSGHYYILVVREHLADNKMITTYIDPMYVGNVGRFINHSCNPNLYMVPVRINNNIPRIALFTLRDIQVGEELTFSYLGTHSVESIKRNKDTLSSSSPVERRNCMCGAENCMGFLPLDSTLFRE